MKIGEQGYLIAVGTKGIREDKWLKPPLYELVEIQKGCNVTHFIFRSVEGGYKRAMMDKDFSLGEWAFCDTPEPISRSEQPRLRARIGDISLQLPSVQPEPKWIPCDKGEPDEDTECWVTVKTTDTLYRGIFTKRYGERRNKGFITSDGFMWWNTALAWMPIYEPEPWKGGQDERFNKQTGGD